jgi:hypothetical protein
MGWWWSALRRKGLRVNASLRTGSHYLGRQRRKAAATTRRKNSGVKLLVEGESFAKAYISTAASPPLENSWVPLAYED